MLNVPFRVLSIFVCIVALSTSESFEASEKKLRVLVFESKDISFKADKEKTFLVKGLGPGWVSRRNLKFKLEKGQIKFSMKTEPYKWANLKNKSQIIIRTRDPRGIWLNKRRYSGEMRLINKGNRLLVINHLSLNKYLKSVVGSEMPKDWPMEALKAQAVAARTYALNQMKGNDYYDLDSNVSSQVYLGMESETNRTRRAVAATRNLVLLHNGKLIDAVFHSSSGGKTEDSKFVWGRYNPYLVSVKDYDQNSPHYYWKKKIPSKSLEHIFPRIGGVNAIRILEKTDTNRIKKVKIYGPKGNLFLSGKELRNIFELKSTLISFKIVSKPFHLEGKRNRFFDFIKSTKTINSRRRKVSRDTIEVDQLNELPPLPENDFLLVQGSGSGHGVGMSQWGAKGLAERGATFRKILSHFYKGARITKL